MHHDSKNIELHNAKRRRLVNEERPGGDGIWRGPDQQRRFPCNEGCTQRRAKREEFDELYEGPFDLGRMCVECRHCAAMLFPSECSEVIILTII